ncbi:MAG TPA: trimethylamine methyltransferase [Candidatus Atribacteria bacterium]|nr:trimethylamine methyltransferase [Candidatus Atribacteria bacterium]
MTAILSGGQYKPLSPSGVKEIYDTSLRLLEKVGVEVNCKEVLEIFKEKGAEVNFDTRLVKLSRKMVEDAIDTAPSKVILYGREDKHNLVLEDKNVYFGTGGTVLNVLDWKTNQKRPSTLEDVAQFAKLVDALDNVHFYLLPLYPTELPKEIIDVNRFYAGISNTSKHIMGGIYDKAGLLETIKMAEEIAGGADRLRKRPFISFITCVMSPLKLENTYTEFLIEIARRGLPVACPSEVLTGATGPVTLAGDLVLINAETLACVTLTQLVNPGTPVIYASSASIMDMQKGVYLSAGAEAGLINAGVAQLAQNVKLPYYATAGMSDSKIPDAQAGYESAISALAVALAGANFIHDAAGNLEFCMTISFEKAVIDNDILGMVMRMVKGIKVDKGTLAEDLITKVGPAGNFLAEMHTVQNMRKELYFPTMADRKLETEWEELGSKDTRARAREKVEDILTNHKPLPIPTEVYQKLKSKIKGLI